MSAKRNPVHDALERDLAALRLTRIAEIYKDVFSEAARKGMSMLEVLSALIAEEADGQRARAIQRRITKAKLPKEKRIEDYDFTFPKRIPKQAILRLFDCDFVDRHENGVFIGGRGTGKTHLLVALGYRAAELGINVRYTRVVDMLNELVAAQVNGTLTKALRQYVRPTLLLADEVGYIPIDKRGADLMFQVVAARYETGSIVLTTNRRFKQWGTIFDSDTTLATAMIDRLMHHGETYAIKGDSYRMKDKNEGLEDPDDPDLPDDPAVPVPA